MSTSRHDRRLTGLHCGRGRQKSVVMMACGNGRNELEIGARTTVAAALPTPHESVTVFEQTTSQQIVLGGTNNFAPQYIP